MNANTASFKKSLDECLSNIRQQTPQEMVRLLILLLEGIEALGKVTYLSADRTVSKELHILHKLVERVLRLLRLQIPSSEPEFGADMMWMSEQGESEDLMLLQDIKNDPPFTSEHIERLIEIAIRSIEQRVKAFPMAQPQAYNAGGPSDFVTQRLPTEPPISAAASIYRVFCPEDARDFPQGVRVLQRYEAFAIVSATPDAVSELRKRCPVEILEDENDLRGGSLVRSRETAMHNMVVRFIAPICDEWKKQIEDAGTRIIQPLDDFSIIISVPVANVVERIRKLEGVRSVYAFNPDIRARAESLHGLEEESTEEETLEARQKAAAAKMQEAEMQDADLRGRAVPGLFIASFFTREYRDRAAEELSVCGIKVVSRSGEKRLIVDISSTENALNDFLIISRLEGLRVLEEETIETPSNDIARKVVIEGSITIDPDPIGSVALDRPGFELTGKGEIIAVADTGLDTGDESTLHPDFRERIRLIKSYPMRDSLKEKANNPDDNDGPADLYSGHGTHVAGSAVGNGTQAKALNRPLIQGTAPEACLIFQAVDQTVKWSQEAYDDYQKIYHTPPPERSFFGIPNELGILFEEAYANGARIHSNSWGGGGIGHYNRRCEDVDEFVWNHRDFLIVFAAGNKGRNSFSHQKYIDQPSVDPPGTAKNCLTVGASENERKEFKNTYGQHWEKDFPFQPFYEHIMADSIDHIAAISSRGPCSLKPKKTDDVLQIRRKPDVVAPGTFILSTRSSQVSATSLGFPWVQYPDAQTHYIYNSGTSMSAPLVAGCAALVRQYLREKRDIPNPSAALLKASLIHSAVYLNDPNPHPSSSKWADNEQGWGRVNLKNIIDPDGPTQVFFIDEPNGLANGEERVYEFEVNKWDEGTDKPPVLRVTLVYTDFPGENLENNLNLFLFSPEKRYYLGNYFEDTDETDSINNSEDERMPEPDSMNNVEGIIVRNPVAGVWSLKVVASQIKHDRQDFALVVSGDIKGDVTVVEK